MFGRAVWYLIIFGPSILVGLFGIRAARVRKNEAWADYRDTGMVLEWIVAPMIVVAVPYLSRQRGMTIASASLTGAAAILLFYAATAAFSPRAGEFFSPRRMIAGSGAGVGVSAFLAYCALTGNLSWLIPSAYLYLVMLWAAYLGLWAVGCLLRNDYKYKHLGPGELFDRVKEIAHRCGVELEHVMLIRSIPGNSKFINALAMHGTAVAISTDLVSNLSKPEVDAVIEHEIGHIADERIWTLDQSLRYGCYLVILAAMYLSERCFGVLRVPWFYLLYAVWLVMYILPEMMGRWYSRRCERTANKNVGNSTDPLSVISGFYKLAALNNHPVSRPWWSRIISTHPCMDEEIKAIALRDDLSSEQVDQTCRQAEDEILHPCDDRYEITSAEDSEFNSEGRVKRPGSGAGWKVAITSLIGGVVFFAICLFTALATSRSGLCGLFIFIGIVGCMLIIILPIDRAGRARLRRMCEQIEMKLKAKYGDYTASQSILVDAVLPEWLDWNEPWQGVLLNVSNGELCLLGEEADLRIPLSNKTNVSRWANQNSTGAGALMVKITYEDGGALQTAYVRILGRPQKSAPRDWKQLEKHIRNLLTSASANSISRKELMSHRRGRLKWSSRVPVSIAIYLAILAMADYLARILGDSGWFGRAMWGLIATAVAGPGLWAWITRAYEPKGSAKE